MSRKQSRGHLWLSWGFILTLGFGLITSLGCGDSKKPTAEMPKEKPNLGQPEAPPPIPPPPK
jgi:hypothetical protein